MSTVWMAVIAACIGCYIAKIAGAYVPHNILDKPVVKATSDAIPIALLSALVAVQTFGVGQTLVIDARFAGLLAAVVALLLRAPFIVVVLVAAATAAALRHFGFA